MEILTLEELATFLKAANLNTYANEKSEKVDSLRLGSHDYHFEKGGLVYHDTYFGGTKFIGEEIIYKDEQPVWGMNYRGITLSETMSEGLFDAILRPALMAGSGDNIPVRGPKEFVSGDWQYTFKIEGDLSNFTGVEEITKKGEIVCRLLCHGGWIK